MPAAWATWSAVCCQVLSWAAARPRSAATTAPAAITTTEESAAATNAASSRQASGPQARSPVTAQAQAIADPVHRLDDGRPVGPELVAQVLHVRVDAALVAGELVTAHAVDQLVAGVRPAGHGRQRGQQAE